MKRLLVVASLVILTGAGCQMSSQTKGDVKTDTNKPSTGTSTSGKMSYSSSVLAKIKANSTLAFGNIEVASFIKALFGTDDTVSGYVIRAHGEGDQSAAVLKIETVLTNEGYKIDVNNSTKGDTVNIRSFVKGSEQCRITTKFEKKFGPGGAVTILSEDVQVVCGNNS